MFAGFYTLFLIISHVTVDVSEYLIEIYIIVYVSYTIEVKRKQVDHSRYHQVTLLSQILLHRPIMQSDFKLKIKYIKKRATSRN